MQNDHTVGANRDVEFRVYRDALAGGCHLGITRMHRALQQTYFWHAIYQRIYDYITSFDCLSENQTTDQPTECTTATSSHIGRIRNMAH